MEIKKAESVSINTKGTKSAGGAEVMDLPVMTTSGMQLPPPLRQDPSTNTLITPGTLLNLQDDQQYKTMDHLNVPCSDTIDGALSVNKNVLNTMSLLHSPYQLPYKLESASKQMHSFMDAQSTKAHANLEYLHRSAIHPFAANSLNCMLLMDHSQYSSMQLSQSWRSGLYSTPFFQHASYAHADSMMILPEIEDFSNCTTYCRHDQTQLSH